MKRKSSSLKTGATDVQTSQHYTVIAVVTLKVTASPGSNHIHHHQLPSSQIPRRPARAVPAQIERLYRDLRL